jgi:hypothetical protein
MTRMIVWGVFDHPAEYPESWVAREFEVLPAEFRPTGRVIEAPTLENLHRILRELGLDRSYRFTEEIATLKEAWQ